MVKQLETRFKRIETKYVVSKDNHEDLLADLKEYLVEDDYPTSTISNIYFDTDNLMSSKMPLMVIIVKRRSACVPT